MPATEIPLIEQSTQKTYARVMRRRLAVGEMDKIALIMPGDVAGYLTTGRSRRAPA